MKTIIFRIEVDESYLRDFADVLELAEHLESKLCDYEGPKELVREIYYKIEENEL